jgi:hypothetical protein
MRVAVGDELAFLVGFGRSYEIHKVDKITPSGRIKCGYWELNPDLTIRTKPSYSGPSSGIPVTDEIRQRVRRETMITKLTRAPWNEMSSDDLEEAHKVLEKHKAKSDPATKEG